MKIPRLVCASELITSWRPGLLIVLLLAIVSANAYAVLRPPFPVRATPPSHGHWIVVGSDSIGAWPRASTPARER